MNKFNSGKISILAFFVSLIAVSFFMGRVLTNQVSADENTYNGCNVSCPSFETKWTTTSTSTEYAYKVEDEAGHYSCDQYPGYNLVGNKCKKSGYSDKNAQWINTTYKCPTGFVWNDYGWQDKDCHKTTTTETEHTATIVYNKSSDDHKCHRPSDSYMEDHYGMTHDAVNAFKQAHSEHYDYTLTAPEGYHLDEDRVCRPNSTPTATPTNSPSATPTPTATPNDPCGDKDDDVCATATPTATPTETTTPAPTDNNDHSGEGDGLGCATHDCSVHPQAPQVLGASTGKVLGASTMAKTGSFDETLYQAIMSVGATLSAFGLKGLKKNKKSSAKVSKKATKKVSRKAKASKKTSKK